jgi:hypothetical protein
VHATTDLHATASKLLSVAPLKDCSIAHFFPFQASVNVSKKLAIITLVSPTAVHALAEEHETADRKLPNAPVGFGVGSIVHFFPFQASANVRVVPDLSTYCPTAVHAEAEAHDTADSELSFAPFGLEACSFVHFFPSVHVLPDGGACLGRGTRNPGQAAGLRLVRRWGGLDRPLLPVPGLGQR